MAMPAPPGLEVLQPAVAAVAMDFPSPEAALEPIPLTRTIGAAISAEALLDGRRDAAYAAAKRLLDVVGAAVLLIMLLPVFALIAIAIKLDSPGQILYCAERIGLHGRRFCVVKFRSMRCDTDSRAHAEFIASLMRGENGCTVYKVPNDRRITRVGAVLRRTSIDELPQLWNVLRGEMSLVGPRPDVPYAADKYEPWMRRRLLVKPGMTGLWQVSGRSRLSLLDMYHLDSAYADSASLGLDVSILLRTIPAVLRPGEAA
jgi:lipopolysaccharide/colanic/teichoic acid biosynthesis glycosyltransferase